ncbi:hypothetical protein AVEN_49617-1 [Araneus ventricosus]|uniref:Uncharacterized protein n=1 Tax=Araneus ventricosus TaxID=182803 RepID=A0A4Y1ZM93_ARAVE|nr:hypothetical protein AVEN_253119-1 [Araneus ventricosus]GBL57747.1 hypothetical protein AVEN_49617-1 [Araneus ventricosus]
MFTLSALLYLKVLPLFRQCLYDFILLYLINLVPHMLVGRLSPHWSSPSFTPFLGRPRQCEYFNTTPSGGHLAPKDLACTRPAYTAFSRWNPVSNLEPSKTLPPGHRGFRTALE